MNALDFLYKLTSFPKILAVNSLEMTPQSGSGDAGSTKLSIKINATAFVFKETSNSKQKPADDCAGVPMERKNEG